MSKSSEKSNEQKRIRYHYRKDNGLCVDCGEPLDTPTSRCSKCRAYINGTRKMYQSMGICPSCRQEKLFGDEKLCITCRAYHVNKANEYRENHRERYRELYRLRSKRRIQERKAKGLCTKCGKVKATVGFSTCVVCRQKSTEYSHRLSRYKGTGYSNLKWESAR